MNNLVELKQTELEEIVGGELIITGALIYTGVKLAASSFALGYTIGKAIKYN